ncbi:MAG: AEC family transporter [Spirochaetota bacterium]
MLSALEAVVSILLLILLGFVLAKRNWFDSGSTGLIGRLVISVSLPAYMVANLLGGYDRARLLAMLPGLPVPFAVMLLSFAIGALVARLARVSEGRRGTFASMFSLSNTIFIGLPVNLVLFGEGSLPYVLLYYIANTTLFWTLGIHGIGGDGAKRSGIARVPLLSLGSLRRVLSPPLVAFVAASLLVLAGFKPPAFLLDLARTVGNMTTPLSMIFIGVTLAAVDWRLVRPSLDMALLLLGRFAIAPLILVLTVAWTDLPSLMKKVFLIQASMPAMTQTAIVARTYGADEAYAGLLTSMSTIASLVTIPLFMALVSILHL